MKSVSKSLDATGSLPEQVHESAVRLPQEHVSPLGLVFSTWLREQVQAPAARWSVVKKCQPIVQVKNVTER